VKRGQTIRLGMMALAAGALASCAASTELSSSWADPTAANHTFQKIVIVGATPKAAVRRMYEDDFVAELGSRSITAVPSYSLTGEGQIDKETASAKLQESGADAVLVTRLVDQEQVQQYYPPTYSSVPSAYYGGWYGYYNMGYTYMTSPGYSETNHVYRLETNLYDRAGDKLLWSGMTQTTTIAGDPPENEIRPLIAVLAADMEKHKVIPPKGGPKKK